MRSFELKETFKGKYPRWEVKDVVPYQHYCNFKLHSLITL